MTNEILNDPGQPVGCSLPEWKGCDRPLHSTMKGQYCQVAPLDVAAHAEKLFQAFAEDDQGRNWTYLPYGPFKDLDEFHCWLNTECVYDDPLFYVILDTNSGRPVGLVSFLRIQPQIGSIEVGHIHYSPSLKRTPAATEAMFLMMAQVFDELGYRRYEWKCDALNEPSRNAATRLGFSFEGIFRQATIYKGRNRDTAWFSVIDEEWPALKEAYQAWLNPANHDAQGRQKRRLSELIAETKSAAVTK